MLRRLLKKLLGIDNQDKQIDSLSKKLDVLISQKQDQEIKLISNNVCKQLILSDIRNAELTDISKEYLGEINIHNSESVRNAISINIEASEAIKKYNLKRSLIPAVDLPNPIISISEFNAHPEKYIMRLQKGFTKFPVGLYFEGINKFLEKTECYLSIREKYGFSHEIVLYLGGTSIYNSNRNETRHLIIKKSIELSDLLRTEFASDRTKDSIQISIPDFIANYNGLCDLILENPGLEEEHKKEILNSFELSRKTFMCAAEIVGTTKIIDASDLLTSDINNPNPNNNILDPNSIDYKIKSSLLSHPEGTAYEDIQKLLPIYSKDEFIKLASERTLEIQTNDKLNRGLTSFINKDLKDYNIGESVVLACYFARNIIQEYSTLEDSVKAIFNEKINTNTQGKCTDYTALALHYLREYLIPLNPEKFKNWHFGVEKDSIGDYKHCFMKIVHIKDDLTVDVCFVDPTMLASIGIEALKNSEDILKYTNTKDHPLQLVRNAEDLLVKPIEKNN